MRTCSEAVDKVQRECVYLYWSLTLDVALYPLQPVRVLLLPDPLVDLRAQLLGSLQGFSQWAAVCVAVWGVLQDLKERRRIRAKVMDSLIIRHRESFLLTFLMSRG